MNGLDIEWKNLRRVLEEYVEYFVYAAQENLLRNGTNASGDLTNSLGDNIIRKNIDIGDDRISVKVELEDYWKYVEEGRPAGDFPSIEKIKRWIEVKPIIPEVRNGVKPTVGQLAFFISRKIEEEGTDPQPFFYPALEDTEKRFEESINLAIDEDLAQYVENTLSDEFSRIFGE